MVGGSLSTSATQLTSRCGEEPLRREPAEHEDQARASRTAQNEDESQGGDPGVTALDDSHCNHAENGCDSEHGKSRCSDREPNGCHQRARCDMGLGSDQIRLVGDERPHAAPELAYGLREGRRARRSVCCGLIHGALDSCPVP
jgi:hypothetical protein